MPGFCITTLLISCEEQAIPWPNTRPVSRTIRHLLVKQLQAEKAATGGTKKRANEEMDAPSLPRANSVRHYIVDALCAGMVEREAIVAHATKASGGRVARADLVPGRRGVPW